MLITLMTLPQQDEGMVKFQPCEARILSLDILMHG
jgi:hypothetical protein